MANNRQANGEMVQGTLDMLLTAAGKKQRTAEINRWRLVVRASGRVLGEAAE